MTLPRWLLLAHQLPTRPSNASVKTWRRLRDIGAVATRNSVYVLPNTEQCREDFEWIRSEIVALGGHATVFAADALDRDGAEDIVAAFQRSREAEYRTLIRESGRLLRTTRGKRPVASAARDALRRFVHGLRERLTEIERIDFASAAGRQEAASVVARLERLCAGRTPGPTTDGPPSLSVGQFQGRRWATRPRPGVDRMASAWLIRRFIDAKAIFAFVDQPAASDIPFDMYTGEFSHQGSSCTFETMAQRFGLTGPAIVRLGHIVHDLDMKETRYASQEAPVVGRMVEGLRQLYPDDQTLLQQGITMFEALARSFEAADATEKPARLKRPRRGRASRRRSKR